MHLAIYLLILKAAGFNTVQELAVAYNQGASGARSLNAATNHYALGVMAHIQDLQKKPSKI